jgi:alkanesulfonate monooxygenase SsuD/methylene tetrahydromethanopterin reductase-like flavin-dependent oxidoreductase (luciferase family)
VVDRFVLCIPAVDQELCRPHAGARLDLREVWEDAVRAVIPMFGPGRVEYHGRHFDFPLRNVLPKPLQKPHPPLWVACSQRDTIEMAGRRGIARRRRRAGGDRYVAQEPAAAGAPPDRHAGVTRASIRP